jgi:hypothetical protein
MICAAMSRGRYLPSADWAKRAARSRPRAPPCRSPQRRAPSRGPSRTPAGPACRRCWWSRRAGTRRRRTARPAPAPASSRAFRAGGQRACQHHEEGRQPQSPAEDRLGHAAVEKLGEQMRMHLQPFRHLAVAARHRRLEIVEVLNIAADQNVTPLDLGAHRGGQLADEQIDRQLGENGIILALRQPVGDRPFEAAKLRMSPRQRIRHQRRQLARLVRPAPHHIVAVGADADAGRLDRPGRRLLQESAQELLLPDLDLLRVARIGRKAEIDRRLQPPQGLDQQRILLLRLIDQDIDGDPLRVHRIHRGERLGERAPVERRAFFHPLQRLVGENDQSDPLVLIDLRGGEDDAGVVERPLGIAGEREGPSRSGRTAAPAARKRR